LPTLFGAWRAPAPLLRFYSAPVTTPTVATIGIAGHEPSAALRRAPNLVWRSSTSNESEALFGSSRGGVLSRLQMTLSSVPAWSPWSPLVRLDHPAAVGRESRGGHPASRGLHPPQLTVARLSVIEASNERASASPLGELVQRRPAGEGSAAALDGGEIATPVSRGFDPFVGDARESAGNGHRYVFRKQRAAIERSPADSPPAIARAPFAPASEPAVSVNERLIGSEPAPSTTSTAAESSSQPAAAPDIEELVEQVSRRLFRHLEIEYERRGSRTWG
jgi:hypothetical protein